MKISKPNKSYKMKTASNVIANKVKQSLILLLASCLLPLASVSFADEYHYNNILIGDRASGMGGAYTAISDDPSGLYYNPAGIVYSVGGNISASVNAYHMTTTKYKDVLGGGLDWERKSSAFVPNFFGIIQPLGKGVAGFSYAVPDSSLENQDQIFNNIPGTTISRRVINFNKKDNIYNFGPSYALKLSKSLSAGVTLYGHYRENEWILNMLTNLNTGEYELLNVYYEISEYGIKPVLGMVWSPADKFAVGLSLAKTTVLVSNVNRQEIFKDITYDGNTIYRDDVKSNDKRVFPFAANVGVGYFATDALIFSGDFAYYSKTDDPNFGSREATWNIAFGSEYYFSEKLALRGGIFSNRANTPVIKTGYEDSLDHVDLYGGSFSVSRFTRQSSLTLGASFSLGTGDAQILGGKPIQVLTMQGTTLFLSSSYSY